METTNKNENIMPELASFESAKTNEAVMKDVDMNVSLEGNWIDLSKDYPESRYLLRYRGVEFCALGGIQAITGHQKNGKTFLMCQLMAALLNSSSARVKSMLPGLELNPEVVDEVGDPTVLYIDTEQEIENTVKVARRVLWLCGWETKQNHPRFRVLWLRSDSSTSERWSKVKKAINEMNPTAIFLDGIRDVINDFNDLEQSSNLINQCMSISTSRNCCFWSVLHKNPGGEKMRGHLGTELANKVSDTFNIEKKKNADGIVFEVSQSDARGKDVENWTFCITDACGKLGIPSIVSANPIAARQVNGKTAFENRDFQNMTPKEWVDICLKLDEIFAKKSVYKTSDLIEEIKEKFKMGKIASYRLIQALDSNSIGAVFIRKSDGARRSIVISKNEDGFEYVKNLVSEGKGDLPF